MTFARRRSEWLRGPCEIEFWGLNFNSVQNCQKIFYMKCSYVNDCYLKKLPQNLIELSIMSVGILIVGYPIQITTDFANCATW